MFSLFKRDPVKALRKRYNDKLTAGMNAQRNGDIKKYSELTAEADALWKQIQAIEGKN